MKTPLPVSLVLALRYLRPRRTLFSVITVVSVLGVLIGGAVLLIVISVMTGFDLVWRDRILGFQAHVTLSGAGPIEADEPLLRSIESAPGVLGAAPYVQGLVFLSHEGLVKEALLRGVDPALERRVSRVPDSVVEGAFDPGPGRIVIGSALARQLGARVGDTLTVLSPVSLARAGSLRLPEDLVVAGVFDVGMYDLDLGYAFTSLAVARDLFGLDRGVHAIQVRTADPDRAPEVAAALAPRLPPGIEARTWMEINRQLFAVLQTEKNMMFFLLIFITIVAAFGIMNTLITVTVQKTREIGLLKALGMPSGGIMAIFLWQGAIAGAIGTVAGIGAGLAALHWRNDLLRFLNRQFGVSLLPPEFYQLAEIPSRTLPSDVAVIAGSVLVICLLAGLLPAWRAARLDPAAALRYE